MPEYEDVPKAAFIHLTDGHEDTLTMTGSIDDVVANFVHSTGTNSNPLLIVLADPGLH